MNFLRKAKRVERMPRERGRVPLALLVCLGAAAASLPATASAYQDGFGVGLIAGEPTGLSAKLWLGRNTAVDAAAAWSFSGVDALHLHADFLVHRFDLVRVEHGALPVYYGVGGRLKIRDQDSEFGVRIPLGLAYLFESNPIDVFVEVVPLVDLAPDTDFELNASVGVRYFFR